MATNRLGTVHLRCRPTNWALGQRAQYAERTVDLLTLATSLYAFGTNCPRFTATLKPRQIILHAAQGYRESSPANQTIARDPKFYTLLATMMTMIKMHDQTGVNDYSTLLHIVLTSEPKTMIRDLNKANFNVQEPEAGFLPSKKDVFLSHFGLFKQRLNIARTSTHPSILAPLARDIRFAVRLTAAHNQNTHWLDVAYAIDKIEQDIAYVEKEITYHDDWVGTKETRMVAQRIGYVSTSLRFAQDILAIHTLYREEILSHLTNWQLKNALTKA